MLLFYVGDERYAIASKRVVEVLPRVALKKLHQAPPYIAGLFNYRNRIVPVIDLSHLIRGNPCRSYLSTRIVLVNYQNGDRQASDNGNSPNANSSASRADRILGLMAERVTETADKPDTVLAAPEIQVDAAPYAGQMILDEQGMIQCIRVDALLSELQRASVLAEAGL